MDSRDRPCAVEPLLPARTYPRLLSLGNIRATLRAAALLERLVGIGARRQVERLATVGAKQVLRTFTDKLLDREDHVLRIGIALRQSVARQQVALDPKDTV